MLGAFGSSSRSIVFSSTHSTRAFHTLAISSQPGRLGRSIWPILVHASSDSELSRSRFERINLIPSSLTHTISLPDSDHLIVLIAPSPLCRTVSVPLFPVSPRPKEPSQLEAWALPPASVELELVPIRPPTVRTRLPASPPEIYVLSFLYLGDSATLCTGLPKLRRRTSFWSTREAMHTFPSIDDVAM